MKKKYLNCLPKGWTLEEIQEIADYYDDQSPEEGAREIEKAPEVDEAVMIVPRNLVPQIRKLIANSSKGRAKPRGTKPRRAA